MVFIKLHTVSDIHLEYDPFDHVEPECDVVILAGDIGGGVQGVEWALKTFDKPVIYVPGNHEYYGRDMIETRAAIKAAAEGTHVHVLDNDAVEIDGVTFMGTTLWTDFNLFGNPMSEFHCEKNINDFQYIRRGDAMITARDLRFEHYEATDFLRTSFTRLGKTVVVTHHLPSAMSVLPQYKHDPLTPGYASRLENLLLDMSPALWVHGHVHNSADYMLGDTRVVCNPRGTSHRLNNDFDPNLVIEI